MKRALGVGTRELSFEDGLEEEAMSKSKMDLEAGGNCPL